MKAVNLIIVFTFLTLFVSACGQESGGSSSNAGGPPAATATATPDEFAAVRPIYKEQCSKCHGEGGDGGQVTVENKKLRVPSFKAAHAMKHSNEDFVEQIVNGGDGMPTFKGKLQPSEIDGLISFIRKEFQKR